MTTIGPYCLERFSTNWCNRSLVVELTRPGSSASTRTRNALGVGDLLDPRDRVGVQLHRRTEASKNPRTYSAVTEDLYRRSIRGEESPSDSRRLPNLNYVPAKFELRDGWNGATTVRRSEEVSGKSIG